jgi:glutamyl-tRNA synthetase
LVLRNEDLDRARCRPAFVEAMFEDLRWFGLVWEEGPDVGGPWGPYNQSECLERYRAAFERLRAAGAVYPCTCSRRDIRNTLTAPHAGDEEPVYPGTCRPALEPEGRRESAACGSQGLGGSVRASESPRPEPGRPCWRFRVCDGEEVRFADGGQGPQGFVAGQDFGDFVVWRPDDLPSYQLACVVDDAAMGITEVVRGADLLVSTARQLLLYRALGWEVPAFFHCPLVTDAAGKRLAKRHDAASLRAWRERGMVPEALRALGPSLKGPLPE